MNCAKRPVSRRNNEGSGKEGIRPLYVEYGFLGGESFLRKFAGKVCVVTGGGSGLGRALCLKLAAEGAQVSVADLDERSATVVVEEIMAAGGKAEAAQVDITDPASVGQALDAVLEGRGKLDYMFNNAGITVIGEFQDLPLEEITKVLNVNLHGALHGSHYAYRIMAKQGFGHIVNTASGFGLVPGPTNLPYVMSKFGIVGLSETLRYEALDLGVKVTTVCPGYIQTPLIERLRTYNANPNDVIASIPVKMVDPNEAAGIILRGVEKNKAIIAFPGYVSFLSFLYHFAPKMFLQYSLKTIRGFRKFRKQDGGVPL
jgi:NAD(P)-dependent dehydrogenase (short-subunit alcohol dehydrogenase family)